MRKLILLALFVLGEHLAAQTTPSQFAGLLTNAMDLTCGGAEPCSTWPMPANPGMGGSYTDPTWGTTTWELAIPPQNTAGVSPGVIPSYSRVQAFSSDNKHLFLSETGSEYADLYDATTTPPTPINRITTTDGSWISPSSGDAYWSNTVPTRIYYIGGFSQVGAMQIRYVDVSGCTTSNCVLTPTIVHTFSCTSDSYFPGGAGVQGNQIESGSGAQGGFFDSTDTYFSFSCDVVNGNGRGEIDLIRYNRNIDTVTTQEKWYNVCPGGVPSGCQVWSSNPGYNMMRMNQHPSANYIGVVWQCGDDTDATWRRGCGTEYFGPTYNFLGPASAYNGHQDTGFDVNGVPVWVGVTANRGNIYDAWSIEITNLTTLSPTGLTDKVIYLPCQYIRVYTGSYPCTGLSLGAKGPHISMTGTWGSTPGYGLFSTYTLAGSEGAYDIDMPLGTTLGTAVTSPGVQTVTPASMANIGVGTQQVIEHIGNANIETVTVTAVTSNTFTANFTKTHTASAPISNLTAGDTGTFALENIAVKIDTTAPDQSNAQFWRLGRVMSIRDNDYNAEAHTTVNRDFTAYIWGSNWNTDGGPDNAYYTKLSTSGTGSGLPSAQISASAAPNPVTVGQSVTLTATVAKSGSAIPTGSINFMNGSASLGQASLDNTGTATLALSWLPVGSYELTAVYSGDSNYATGQSGSAPLQVQSPTTASLNASPNPVTVGQTLTLTATLTGDGSLWPTGMVSFLSGSTLLGTATLNASGVATLPTTLLAAGTYSLTVQYAGDGNFLSSTSAAVSVTVNAQTTTTSLNATPNPLPTGQTLTLTATVQGTGSNAPGGTVNFMSGSTLLGSGTLNSSGVATLTNSSLATGAYSLTAQYAGNANFLSSTSATASVTVSSQATTTGLTANPNPVTAGQTLTLTATVQGSGSTAPGGTVNFMSGSTLLGSGTLNSSGVATLTNSSLASGTYSLTAQYAGNANFLSSTSATASVTVSSQATTTGLTANPNPVTAGQTLTLTATVQGSGSTAPGGTVNFMSGSTLLGSGTLNSSGVATLTTSSLAAGPYSLTAQYSGNANFLASTSGTVSLTVNAQATTTTTSLIATPNPVATGQTLSLTATVVQGTGSTAPGGTVNFFSGSTPLGTAPLNSSGVATLTLTTLAVGTYSLTAHYAGNTNFVASTSAAVSVTVGAQATTTSLMATPNPVTAGQTLTLTATVLGSGSTAPGGTVSFMNGSASLGSAILNSSGVATLTTSSLAAGPYNLTAQYAGNANFLSSASAAVSVTVNAPVTSTTTSLFAAPNPVITGQTLTLTATVLGTGSGSTTPGGTVSFLSGSTPLGTAALNSSGVATLTLTTLAIGTYNLTAQYLGNANFLTSTSAAVSVTVSAQATNSATTTSLTATPNPIAIGQTLTLTATVHGGGTTTPGGTVSFINGSTPMGTSTLNSSGVATLTLSTLAVGNYNLTAQYAGNANFLSSSSAAVSVTVDAQATTTSLTATPNPVTTGQTLTLTATVQGPDTPDGTVSFLSGSTLLGTGTINSSGIATLTTTQLAAGTYSLTAQYSGDADLLASTSAATSLTVSAQTIPTGQAFSLNSPGGAWSQTVEPGKTAVYTLNISPAPGTTLPAITFTLTGLPQGYTATFSPPTIAAGSGATNVTLTIQVPAQTATAMLERDRNLHTGLSALAFCILLLPFGGRFRRSSKRLLQLSGMMLLLFGLASVVGLAGCTAPPGQLTGQNAQTFNLTITTTSASMSQTANVTLIVE